MNDEPLQPPIEARRSRKGAIVITVLATLAFVLILEKLLVIIPNPSYEARLKRSEALLAAQERRSKGYDEYYEGARADQKRNQALLSRQGQDLDRFERILSKWEEQQKTYQTYLNSLKPSH